MYVDQYPGAALGNFLGVGRGIGPSSAGGARQAVLRRVRADAGRNPRSRGHWCKHWPKHWPKHWGCGGETGRVRQRYGVGVGGMRVVVRVAIGYRVWNI